MNRDLPENQFLSEEDLALRDLSWDELIAQWNAWRRAASATDPFDEPYEHGVFQRIREDLLPLMKHPPVAPATDLRTPPSSGPGKAPAA